MADDQLDGSRENNNKNDNSRRQTRSQQIASKDTNREVDNDSSMAPDIHYAGPEPGRSGGHPQTAPGQERGVIMSGRTPPRPAPSPRSHRMPDA